jgi:diadenosine tetraphosphate (Ap4A) HIT family hydrolase
VEHCPFCNPPGVPYLLFESDHAIAFPDAFPVALGHTLVIPRRHVPSIWELSREEQIGIWDVVAKVREHLLQAGAADAFNIGVNDGLAAGQTLPHAHVHIIPRRNGDVADPRGGIRWIIEAKANYWDREPS